MEPLSASSTEIPDTVDSAASLLKQSALAMRELESFATTTELLQWESNDQQGNSRTFDPLCNYYANEYRTPDSYRARWLTLEDTSPSDGSMSIVVGSTRYRMTFAQRSVSSPKWIERECCEGVRDASSYGAAVIGGFVAERGRLAGMSVWSASGGRSSGADSMRWWLACIRRWRDGPATHR